MLDDPRMKRVLKRYPKDSQTFDASIELVGVTTLDLQAVFGCAGDDLLYSPRQLGELQLSYFRDMFQVEFDCAHFDYFLHTYVRREHTTEYFATQSAGPHPAPEDGPPSSTVRPGKVWVPVRPKDGREHFLEYDEPA